MSLARRMGLSACLMVAVATIGCGAATESDEVRDHQAARLEDQEGEVCGMLVRENSAPRSQVVHRDGSQLFFCSIGDMLVHLSAPSPHGRTEAIFVEVMEPGEDPMQPHTGVHPWVLAEQATFVVGIERRGIMGDPVLSYATADEAERAMQGYPDAQLLDMTGLREWWTQH